MGERPPVPPAAVLGLFFLSGAAGLIYEISWARQIGLLFGHTVHAAAVTLGAYFGGMALGYAGAARLLPRLARPLWAYGIAELSVAAWALLTPQLVTALTHPALAALLSPESEALRIGARGVAAFAILSPASLALGATLPLVAEHLRRSREPAGVVTLAYATNTLGAVAGVMLATFVLLLLLGVRGSGQLAAGISALCGFAAIGLGRHAALPPETLETPPPIAPRFYVVAGVSGATVLSLEVLYTRMFALSFHNSTYTFGVVIAVFLVALALGSALAARVIERDDLQLWMARAALLAALSIPLSVVGFVGGTGAERFGIRGGFSLYVIAASGLVTAVVLLPVLAMGTLLPMTWGAAGGERGRIVGPLTAVNTACAALGSMAASFVVLPSVGLWNGFALVAAVYVALAGHLFGSMLTLRRLAALGGAAALVVLFVMMFRGLHLGYDPKTHHLLGRWESAYGWVDVIERTKDGRLDLRHNSRYRLGSSKLAHYEVRQGHIPLLLHPAPRDVLYLGLATGVTSSSALYHPEVRSAEIVELIPDVVEAARLFSAFNRGVVDSPKVRIVINDARHHLHASRRRYDVIVSDLFIPWESKTGYLYTVEHYRAAREHLKPGGHFCQWIHPSEVGVRELELIADSLASVFSHLTLWKGDLRADVPILAMVGSDGPLTVDGAALARRLSAMPPPPAGKRRVLIRPRNLLDLFVGRWKLRHPGFLNSDEHPRVEFLAPITQRERGLLKRDRLEAYYRHRLMKLPTTGLDYRPAPGEAAPDLTRGRRRQLARFAARRRRPPSGR